MHDISYNKHYEEEKTSQYRDWMVMEDPSEEVRSKILSETLGNFQMKIEVVGATRVRTLLEKKSLICRTVERRPM